VTLAPISALKALPVAVGSLAAIAIALRPEYIVALIGGGALVLAAVPLFVVQLMTLRATQRNELIGLRSEKVVQQMHIDVDGNLKKLIADKEEQALEMIAQSRKLAHAEGAKQGSDEERNRA
jgi:hypothetical protein